MKTFEAKLKTLCVFLLSIAGMNNIYGQQLSLTPSNYNGFHVSCFGGSDGSIDLSVSGGTPPYTILWSTNDTIEDLTALPAGYYRVNVDDSDTLTDPVEAEITLSEPRRLTLAVSAFKYPNGHNISLYGACNGLINTTTTDGVAPYSWLWSTGSTTQNITSVCAGVLTVTVTDANGCIEKNLNVAMTQPDRSDWQIGGNLNIDDSTQFIGTLDGNDLVFKTDGLERARLKANGDFYINRIISNRILSEDSIFAIGPNSFHFSQGSNNISVTPGSPPAWNPPVTVYGLGIGHASYGLGQDAIAIGEFARGAGVNSLALGHYVYSNATNAITIGSGFNGGVVYFENDIDNSIMMGMNSRKPTLFLSPGDGSSVNNTGAVGINTTFIPADYKLAVNGRIIATEVLVRNPGVNFSNWPPDYVFYKDYPLMGLPELQEYIFENCHLPEVPTAEMIVQDGIKVSEMQLILLKKIEELTLYIIKQQEAINSMSRKLNMEPVTSPK
jgi:hypothetical protein